MPPPLFSGAAVMLGGLAGVVSIVKFSVGDGSDSLPASSINV